MAEGRQPTDTYLLVPVALAAVLLVTATIRGPTLVSQSGFGSAILVAAPLILATYALMALAVAGRGTVDLAVGPLVAFINVSVVQLNGLGLVTGPIEVFAVALGIGVIYQLVFASLIVFVRVQPIIVALSGFLALSGINLVILPRPGGSAPAWMSAWGLGSTLFSPILLIVLVATAGWLLFTLTAFYANLRLMGYDERAAYTSGVRTVVVRMGAHAIAGLFVGLSAICYTALIGSGDPTQGTTLTLTSVTAVVLGGVSLAGGRGGVTGALLGAINLFLIGYVLATFDFGAIQAFVTQLCYGLILIMSLLLTLLVPVIARRVAFVSPYAAFVVLGLIVGATMLQISTIDTYAPADATADAAAGAAPGATGGIAAQAVAPASSYLLLPPPGPAAGGPALSPLARAVFTGAAALLAVTAVLRLMVVEARSRRLGVFLYACIGALVVLLLLVAAQSPALTAPLTAPMAGAPR